jgi:transposase
MNAREERGLQIVLSARYGIKRKGGVWIVPSQSGNGKYTVCLDPNSPHCSCPDHEETGCRCKHIYAAEYVYQRELFDDGSVAETETITVSTKRATYSQQWSSYNRAQVNEKAEFQALLKDLCDRIQEPPRGKMGRPRMPLNDSIFAAVFKVYSTVSGRRFISDLRDAKEKGLIKFAPAYNSIFKVLESEETTSVLKALVIESAKPLKAMETTFACDSTGFSGCRFERWYDHKFGDIKIQRTWCKAHIMTGTNTNVITAVEIHHKDAADCVQFRPLLETTAGHFDVQEVCADLAYSTHANLQACEDVNAKAFIPFKKNASAVSGGLWAKMFHYFQLHRESFFAKYHQRSNAESTFSMVKAKFGDSCRSKTETAMRNEVLAKFVCHNICCLISAAYQMGVDPTLWAGSSVAHNVGQAG